MDYSFSRLSKFLINYSKGLDITSEEAFDYLPFERLVKCVKLFQVSGYSSVTKQDIAVLLRHALRLASENGIQNAELTVPNCNGWPDLVVLKDHGMQILMSYSSSHKIKANSWQPDWLEEELPPFKRAFGQKPCRVDCDIPMDPALRQLTGFPYYNSPGQKTVIRRVARMLPGDTFLINLPTGSGKSLAAWVPALEPNARGLVVVVVPTVALALDQERQIRQSLMALDPGKDWKSQDFAWHSELPSERKQAIRQSINACSQRILFTSPESIVGALRGQLYKLVEEGGLSHFVIDEVHLLSGWGDEFRPAFQALAGIWKGLLSLAPMARRPRTLLMTATLHQQTCDTIVRLFSHHRSQFVLMAAASLRPEPDYWFQQAPDFKTRQQWVIDSLKNAPRPAIVYVTKRDDASDLCSAIKDAGMSRVRAFTGSTTHIERAEIIHAWNGNELDIVVATSAFGVGMDKSDVRTVIHACIPESLDRYYQEVGRGGRDGLGCTSLVLFCEDDWAIAKSLSSATLISVEKGLMRWKEMWHHREEVNHPLDDVNSLKSVDLRCVPSYLDGKSKGNEAWNMRTLLLMARAGLIRLQAPPKPSCDEEEEKNKYYNSVYLQALDGHREELVWNNKLAAYSRKSTAAQNLELQRLEDILHGRVEIAKALCDTYRLQPDGELPGITLHQVCGGCPLCRQGITEAEKSTRSPELSVSQALYNPALKQNLNKYFPSEEDCHLWAIPRPATCHPDPQLLELIQLLTQKGLLIRVVVPDAWVEFLLKETRLQVRYCGFLAVTRYSDWQQEPWNYAEGEAVLIIPPKNFNFVNDIGYKSPALIWLMLDPNFPHVTHPDRKFFDDYIFQIKQQALIERLSQ